MGVPIRVAIATQMKPNPTLTLRDPGVSVSREWWRSAATYPISDTFRARDIKLGVRMVTNPPLWDGISTVLIVFWRQTHFANPNRSIHTTAPASLFAPILIRPHGQ